MAVCASVSCASALAVSARCASRRLAASRRVSEAVEGAVVAAGFFFGVAGGFLPGLESAAAGGFYFVEPVLGCALLGGEVALFGVGALQLSSQPADGGLLRG